MSSHGFPTVRDEVTGRQRTRSYDVRAGSQQYSNIAGLLAGFAFTIIILVAQENTPSLTDAKILNRNIAAIGFFVSFFGCVLASFIFALISGEEALTPRANQMAFFAGAAFSLNISLLFWSLSTILKGFFVEKVAFLAYQIFPFFIIIHPIFVVASILDNIYLFDRREPTPKEYLITIVPSSLTILFVYLLRLDDITISATLNTQTFNTIIKLFLGMIIVGNIVAGLVSTRDEYSRIPLLVSSLWIWLNSILISLLIILV